MIVRLCVVLMTTLLAVNLFAEAEVLKAEKLVFRTSGNDTYADGMPVGAGECYAFVWQEDGYDFTGFPMTPPNPDDPYAMGEHIWLYDYYPVAERSESGGEIVAKCPDVIIGANSLVVWETQHGKWFVYLLDTRHKLADGTVACGFNTAETNAPVRINAYKPVTGLTDIVRGVTYSPVEGQDLTGGATVADLPTDAITYQISFDARGGTVEPPSLTLTYGDAYGVLPVPVRANYQFDGWFTAAKGGDEITPARVATADEAVYAHWSGNPYVVRFNVNDGTGRTVEQPFAYGEPQALTRNSFTREGYAFAGWMTNDAPVSIAYADGAVVSNLTTVAKATVDLSAVWVSNGCYLVTFDPGAGSGRMECLQCRTDGVCKLPPCTLEKPKDKTFAGWTCDSTGAERLYDPEMLFFGLGKAGDIITFKAIWK